MIAALASSASCPASPCHNMGKAWKLSPLDVDAGETQAEIHRNSSTAKMDERGRRKERGKKKKKRLCQRARDEEKEGRRRSADGVCPRQGPSRISTLSEACARCAVSTNGVAHTGYETARSRVRGPSDRSHWAPRCHSSVAGGDRGLAGGGDLSIPASARGVTSCPAL